MLRQFAYVSLLFVGACSLDRNVSLPSDSPIPVGPLANVTCGQAQFADAVWYGTSNLYPCGAVIHVSHGSSGGETAVTSTNITDAVNIWNSGLQASTYGLPTFSPSSGTYQVTINETGTGQYLCGSTVISTGVITINHGATQGNCSDSPGATPYLAVSETNAAQVTALVAHELGHALGLQKHLREASQQIINADTMVRDCIDLTPTTLNSSVCEHERQIVYYQYALRGDDPLLSRIFVYGLSMQPSALSLDLNASGSSTPSLFLRDHNHPEGFFVAPGGGDAISWSLTNVSPAGAFQLSGATVQAVTVPGTGVLQADLTSTSDYNKVWPFNAAEQNGSVALSNTPPAAPPSGLSATSIAATSATVTWVTGDPVATTTVNDRVAGLSAWSTAGSAPANTPSFGLTNLTACTLYDVSVYHVRNGRYSQQDSVLGLFGTRAASGACAPVNFHIVTCSAVGNNEYYNVAWTRTEYSGGSIYEIGQASTNNPAIATVVSTDASSITNATLGPYTRLKPWLTYYFWVRHKLADGTPSAWVALVDNPVKPSIGC